MLIGAAADVGTTLNETRLCSLAPLLLLLRFVTDRCDEESAERLPSLPRQCKDLKYVVFYATDYYAVGADLSWLISFHCQLR